MLKSKLFVCWDPINQREKGKLKPTFYISSLTLLKRVLRPMPEDKNTSKVNKKIFKLEQGHI